VANAQIIRLKRKQLKSSSKSGQNHGPVLVSLVSLFWARLD